MYRDSVIVLLHKAKLQAISHCWLYKFSPKHSTIKTKPQPHWSKRWTIKIFWAISNKLLSFLKFKNRICRSWDNRKAIHHVNSKIRLDISAILIRTLYYFFVILHLLKMNNILCSGWIGAADWCTAVKLGARQNGW